MLTISSLITLVAAIGTLVLALATMWSIYHNTSKEREEKRLMNLKNRVENLYAPLINQFFNAYGGKADTNEVMRISYVNYALAGPKTRTAIDKYYSDFRKINPSNQSLMAGTMLVNWNNLEIAVRSEYEQLLREMYGWDSLGGHSIPTITQEV